MEEKNDEVRKKQKRLSTALIVISLIMAAVMVLILELGRNFMIGMPFITKDEVWNSILVPDIAQVEIDQNIWYTKVMAGKTVFSIISLVLALLLVSRFINVCIQIGRDNSFSMENVKNFKLMQWFSFGLSAVYIAKILWFVRKCLYYGYSRAAFLLGSAYGVIFVGAFLFAIACATLSQLVHNAYEVKSENDLTV